MNLLDNFNAFEGYLLGLVLGFLLSGVPLANFVIMWRKVALLCRKNYEEIDKTCTTALKLATEATELSKYWFQRYTGLQKHVHYLYCILPSGNEDEFEDLDRELIKRGVDAEYRETLAEGRIYRIPGLQILKLPTDEDGAYLGDDTSGHSIYPLGESYINRVCESKSVWKNIAGKSST